VLKNELSFVVAPGHSNNLTFRVEQLDTGVGHRTANPFRNHTAGDLALGRLAGL
jgi:hypothetical protein